MSLNLAARLPLYLRLTRFDKPIGTLLLLWPTLTALWIAAEGRPALLHVAIFTVGTFLMRSAGCAINDAADRDFDGHVQRTVQRVVASGLVSVREAIGVALALAALSALLLIPLNLPTFLLAWVAVGVTATYPLFKRFFPLPQAYLGIAFSFGIPMAFAAVRGEVPAIGWALFVANLFWVMAYDTEYAMVDRDDDLKLGLRSSAILFGRADVAIVMGCYGVFLAMVAAIGGILRLAWPFWLGWLVAFCFALWHYAMIRARSRDGCFRAFLHNQWLGLALFAGVVGGYAAR